MGTVKPGRELDALVAEGVMGEAQPIHSPCSSEPVPNAWKPFYNTEVGYYKWLPRAFSTDIAAAWEVVEKLRGDGFEPAIVGDDHGHWAVVYEGVSELGDKVPWLNVPVDEALWAATVPHAICLAALRAVE